MVFSKNEYIFVRIFIEVRVKWFLCKRRTARMTKIKDRKII